MATAESVKAKIQGLIDTANEATGNGDTDLTTAVNTLIAGFGQGGGGGDEVFIGVLEQNIVDLVLPEGLVNPLIIFYNQQTIKTVTFPSTLESIPDGMFKYCHQLNCPLVFPASLKTIGADAFKNDWRLQIATFKGTPTSIASTAFTGVTKLTTINVPWAEGEVADAPWGATNATINYNYVG